MEVFGGEGITRCLSHRIGVVACLALTYLMTVLSVSVAHIVASLMTRLEHCARASRPFNEESNLITFIHIIYQSPTDVPIDEALKIDRWARQIYNGDV